MLATQALTFRVTVSTARVKQRPDFRNLGEGQGSCLRCSDLFLQSSIRIKPSTTWKQNAVYDEHIRSRGGLGPTFHCQDDDHSCSQVIMWLHVATVGLLNIWKTTDLPQPRRCVCDISAPALMLPLPWNPFSFTKPCCCGVLKRRKELSQARPHQTAPGTLGHICPEDAEIFKFAPSGDDLCSNWRNGIINLVSVMLMNETFHWRAGLHLQEKDCCK